MQKQSMSALLTLTREKIAPRVFCANCGADQAKHEIRTPLGFGCLETGCVQFFPDRTVRAARAVCSN